MEIKHILRRAKKIFSPAPAVLIKKDTSVDSTLVDEYWGRHTVNSAPFQTARESLEYLEWRFDEYPLFRELMDLWGDHTGQTVLDYGCGPGNDLAGFLVHTKAKKVIGVDISEKALELAGQRLALHSVEPDRIELIQISDSEPKIPLEDQSVDYIYCEGVLHHTSYPQDILQEFRRILKPEGSCCIMVYNRYSLWLNLYVAYEKMILQKAFPGLSVEEAFTHCTDGVECPIAWCYTPDEFSSMCREAGFIADFKGGYLSKWELDLYDRIGLQAIEDERLPEEHRTFLSELTWNEKGYPMYRGKFAGIGGVHSLTNDRKYS